MSKDKKILHDISRMVSPFLTSLVNVKNDLSTASQEQIKNLLKGMGFITKNDFIILKKTIEKLQYEIDLIKSRSPKRKTIKARITKINS